MCCVNCLINMHTQCTDRNADTQELTLLAQSNPVPRRASRAKTVELSLHFTAVQNTTVQIHYTKYNNKYQMCQKVQSTSQTQHNVQGHSWKVLFYTQCV